RGLVADAADLRVAAHVLGLVAAAGRARHVLLLRERRGQAAVALERVALGAVLDLDLAPGVRRVREGHVLTRRRHGIAPLVARRAARPDGGERLLAVVTLRQARGHRRARQRGLAGAEQLVMAAQARRLARRRVVSA